ncbi:hypothetical protein X471_00291 [Bartonella bacilliformis str. Heidi Mejia]|nr:hypothetical protein X471_00291 [Bartonella bacilliformis str. Heidi Mejia]KEG18921.1 hypothetical protein H707_00656 [Bartonella bacilliformis Hosp800-02]KEG23433.1 hypothetical protein H708_00664 [Bartonella bacilliformis VAB9028]KEG24378.1 hypothetical protein H706_00666 [Bartonella bacilliformis CAR600-02]
MVKNNKMKLKLCYFFFSLLLTLHTAFAALTPKSEQKHPDNPKDQAIRVKVHTNAHYCYAPAFVNGEGYVYIDYCSSSSALFARYDVFQRVAWNVDGVWLCMTAPGSVTGIGRKSTANWDYIVLRPCVINDPNQRWTIKNNAFYTADEKFRVKDYKWYAYISKNKDDYYDHTLITMEDWIKTVATPVNINLKMFLGWKFVHSSGFSTYYISDDGSKSDVFDLYYNPENGHIARYFPSSGVMSCMASQQSPNDDWNWVNWKFCKDTTTAQQDIGSWNIAVLAGREGALTDYQGNFLRVTQYGFSWGQPYTAKPSYLEQDTTNSPQSNFLFTYDMERWNRYVNGNLGDTLAYCPAPGNKENVVHATKTRVKRSLPPSFVLTEEWKKRLWEIAKSTSSTGREAIAACGVCMLHTLQMLAELQEDHLRGPRHNGEGYFFNTQEGVSPFISFRQRFPVLAARLEATISHGTTPLRVGESTLTRTTRTTRAAASILLPRYEWRPSFMARTPEEMRSQLQNLLRAPEGTLWYIVIIRSTMDGSGMIGHAQPILRTHEGLVLISTNIASMSFDEFRSYLNPTRDPEILLSEFSLRGNRRLYSLVTFQMAQLDEIPLNLYISQDNCTGEGDHRRGTRGLPRTSLINQCGSGRCAIQ